MEALPALLLLAVVIGSLVVWVWALVDALRVRDDALYRTGTKTMWVLFIALTHALGAVIYVLVGRPRRSIAQ
jgi:Phospholipase_D-nuclease N-terminal